MCGRACWLAFVVWIAATGCVESWYVSPLLRLPHQVISSSVWERDRAQLKRAACHVRSIEGDTVTGNVIHETQYDVESTGRTMLRLSKLSAPVFLSLLKDPLVTAWETTLIGRHSLAGQASHVVASAVHTLISKLFNDPLLRSSTSLVAASVRDNDSAKQQLTALLTACGAGSVIGITQSIAMIVFANPLLSLFGAQPDVRQRARTALCIRAWGAPAHALVLVLEGAFRGMADSITPLICTMLGSTVTIVSASLLLRRTMLIAAKSGVDVDAPSAMAIAWAYGQWTTVLAFVVALIRHSRHLEYKKSQWISHDVLRSVRSALTQYRLACASLLTRTLTKVSTLSLCARAASTLSVPQLAAYGILAQLGTSSAQLCEALAIAGQSLLAREMIDSQSRAHMQRSRNVITGVSLLGVISALLWSSLTAASRMLWVTSLSASSEVVNEVLRAFPVGVAVQFMRSASYPFIGLLMGGLDWQFLSSSLAVSSVLSIALLFGLQSTKTLDLQGILLSALVFLTGQTALAIHRIFFSEAQPWKAIRDTNSKPHKVTVDK